MAGEPHVPLPWPAEEVERAKQRASAAGWSEHEIDGFLNGLARLPCPDVVAAVEVATADRESVRSRTGPGPLPAR